MPQWFGKDTDWNDIRRIATGIDSRKRVGAGHDPVTLAASADVLLDIGAGDIPQELSLDTQAANTVLAGPVAGGAAAPTFRLLVAADLGALLPQPVAQGDILIADATPEWAILTLAAGAGHALVSTASTLVWDQTPTWTGSHTWDDGSGDSPKLILRGGSHNDECSIFLNDDATAGDSDLIIQLEDAAGDSCLEVWDSGSALVFSVTSNGRLLLTDDGASQGQFWWETDADDGFLFRHGTNNQAGYVRTTPQGTTGGIEGGFQAYGTDLVAGAVNTEFVELVFDSGTAGWLRTRNTGTGTLRALLMTVGNVTNAGIRIEEGPLVFINESTNANMTRGLTINQATNDNEILALKSSDDVAHPMTGQAEADTYGTFTKAEGGSGGAVLTGYKDADGIAGFALGLAGRLGEAADTDKTTSAIGVVTMDTSVTDGGTGIEAVGADGNLFVIRNHTTARFIFDAEGSAHADVEWTTFGAHDDLAILDLLESTVVTWQADPLKAAFGGFLAEQCQQLEALGIAHFDRDRPGHVMINTTRLSMLLVGAMRQLYTRIT